MMFKITSLPLWLPNDPMIITWDLGMIGDYCGKDSVKFEQSKTQLLSKQKWD